MAFSPYVKAGVALASAAMIAAVPAIAPPLTPTDQKVLADTEATLTASTTDLINIFFGVDPGDGPLVDDDNPSTRGASGVVYRLLWDATNGDDNAQEYVDALFGSGFSGVLQQFLNQVGPAETDAWVDVFFEGGFTAISQTLLTELLPADAAAWVDEFYEGGTSAVQQKLLNQLLPAEADELVNDFYDGGATQLVGNLVLDQVSADQAPYVERFFALNDYDNDTVGAGERGISGVVLQAINQVGPAETDAIANTFFESGFTGLTQEALLAVAGGDETAENVINEFFGSGISGVVRYVLAGPAPEPPRTSMSLFSAKVSEEETTVEAENKTEDVKDVAKTPTNTVSATTPAAGDPAPTGDLAPAAPVKKKFTINKEKATGTEALEGDAKGTTDPEVILEGTSGLKPGTGWDAWNKKVNDFAKAVGSFANPKPATPSAPAGDAPSDDKPAGGEGDE